MSPLKLHNIVADDPPVEIHFLPSLIMAVRKPTSTEIVDYGQHTVILGATGTLWRVTEELDAVVTSWSLHLGNGYTLSK